MHHNKAMQFKLLSLNVLASVSDALSQLNTMGVETQGFGLAVYGKKVTHTTLLQPGDRLELCTPLAQCPREARRRRLERKSST